MFTPGLDRHSAPWLSHSCFDEVNYTRTKEGEPRGGKPQEGDILSP